MTPEETKAMAERIAKNRQEAAKVAKPAKTVKAKPPKAAKPVKQEAKAKAKSTERVKPIGPGTKQFKFKDGPKSREVCDVLKCKAKPSKGFRCNKHKKEIRKVQLAANNIVWKKRRAAGTAGHHVIYTRPGEKKPIATRWSLKATDKAEKVVAKGHSVVETLGDFREAVARTKKERAA